MKTRAWNAHKLFWEDVCLIRRAVADGQTQATVARQFGISQVMISRIVLRQSHKLSPIERRQIRLLRRNAKEHGISVKQLQSFGSACNICGVTSTGRWGTLHTDHDHKTNKVRGKLCVHCNQGLGSFQDSPVLLKKAIIYLRRAA